MHINEQQHNTDCTAFPGEKKQNDADRYQVVGGTLSMAIREGLLEEVTSELRPESMDDAERWEKPGLARQHHIDRTLEIKSKITESEMTQVILAIDKKEMGGSQEGLLDTGQMKNRTDPSYTERIQSFQYLR